MVQKCCVAYCKIRYDLKPTGVMLHRFPRCSTRKAAWLSNVQKVNGTDWHPSDSSFVCSAHFELEAWETTRQDGKRQLRQNAVPSVFHHPSVRFCQTPMPEPVVIPEAPSVPLDHSYMRRPKILKQHEPAETKSAVTKTPSVSLDHSYTWKRKLPHEENVSSSTTPACATRKTDDSGLKLLLCLEPQNKATETITDPQNLSPMDNVGNHSSVKNSKKSEDADVNVPLSELLSENERLKNENVKLSQLAEKMCEQNNTLQKSYSQLSVKYRTLRDIQRRTEEGLKNVFSEDQIEALSRRNTQGLKWHPKTIEEALALKKKCGTAVYKFLQRRFPYPHLRTLQKEIKHQSRGSGIISEVLEPLEDFSQAQGLDYKIPS